MKALVTGAGGMIGGWLVKHLLGLGYEVRATDVKWLGEWWQVDERAENVDASDLRDHVHGWMFAGIDVVFHLAADMGGIGHIANPNASAQIIHGNTLMDCTAIQYARDANIPKFFYSSSVCVYPVHKMEEPIYPALREEDVYPADPNESYGWQKLHTEHILREYHDWAHIFRFQNCYGSHGSWNDSKEKAPAALCRKVAQTKIRNKPMIEVWGDGKATRSFMHVSDCVKAIEELVHTDCHEPITLGPSFIYTIDELLDIICDVADHHPRRIYNTSKPEGVRGRVFNHDKLRSVLGRVPEMTLEEGIEELYPWIEDQVREWLDEN